MTNPTTNELNIQDIKRDNSLLINLVLESKLKDVTLSLAVTFSLI